MVLAGQGRTEREMLLVTGVSMFISTIHLRFDDVDVSYSKSETLEPIFFWFYHFRNWCAW